MTDDFWDDADVVFSYTDEEAVEDGVLIPVQFGGINRVTRTVMEDFKNADIFNEEFASFMNKASEELEKQREIKNDWFYSAIIAGKEYFMCDNGSGFTLMKPEDY